MGRVFSSLRRELRNFDVDNKAFKAISEENIRPPPKHPSTQKEIAKINEEYSVKVEDFMKKDEKLDGLLKDVYVTSESAAPVYQSTRQLPADRSTDQSELQYGYMEHEEVPVGKITLKDSLELLSRYNDDRSKWTPEKLASHYKLDVKFVEQLVDRYNVFELHLPEKTTKTDKMTLESKVQLQRAVLNIHKLALVRGSTKEKVHLPEIALEGAKPT